MWNQMKVAQARLEPFADLALRLGLGVVMVMHGWDKVRDFDQWVGHLASFGVPAPSISIWFAIAGELLGGLGIIAGAFTPIAAFGIAASMAVAILSVHLPNGLRASENGFEYPLVCLVAAALLAVRGASKWSLDALVFDGWLSSRSPSAPTPIPSPAR